MNPINVSQLFSESQLFSQGMQAGEFTFLAQDARGPNGTVGELRTAAEHTRRTLANIDATLKGAGQSLENLVNLSVFLADYADAPAIAEVLRSTFDREHPAVNFVGVCGLEGDCRVCMDALATTSTDRETISVADMPTSIGARCHGYRVGDFVFLSGVDALDANGRIAAPATIQSQTTEVLTRIGKILNQQKLGLGNLCRTFMFIPGTQYRPGYGEARKAIYNGIFAEDEFPPNSGIYVRSLGSDVLLRSMAIAYRGERRIVTSPKVRLAPGSFSQSVRVGDWLLLAGQDAVTFDRAVECEGSLAGQTEATLRHTKDIVEAAGGTLDDIVKTTVYLGDVSDYAGMNEVYRRYFPSGPPARATLITGFVVPGLLVEIEAIAALD